MRRWVQSRPSSNSTEELRDWFDANHANAGELWVGYWKKATGKPSLTWSEAVDEALCVGWIDGVVKRIDERIHMQRFTPRRPRSNWSRINIEKVERLTREGRMRDAGLAAFAARSAERSGVYSYEQSGAAALDSAEQARFEADAAAWEWFRARPPGYRKLAIHWVVSAKRAETRARRLATLIADSGNGQLIKSQRRP